MNSSITFIYDYKRGYPAIDIVTTLVHSVCVTIETLFRKTLFLRLIVFAKKRCQPHQFELRQGIHTVLFSACDSAAIKHCIDCSGSEFSAVFFGYSFCECFVGFEDGNIDNGIPLTYALSTLKWEIRTELT